MKNIALTALMMALVACSSSPNITPSNSSSTPIATPIDDEPHQVHTVQFQCSNGMTPSITYLSPEKIELALEGRKVELTHTLAGSGSRYVSNTGLYGTGADWHEKNHSAFLMYKNANGRLIEIGCERP
ncbi:MAG: MliC family protein [Acinetobacter sp.]|nr:MliC family protein [Acinetobacter sp.]